MLHKVWIYIVININIHLFKHQSIRKLTKDFNGNLIDNATEMLLYIV